MARSCPMLGVLDISLIPENNVPVAAGTGAYSVDAYYILYQHADKDA